MLSFIKLNVVLIYVVPTGGKNWQGLPSAFPTLLVQKNSMY